MYRSNTSLVHCLSELEAQIGGTVYRLDSKTLKVTLCQKNLEDFASPISSYIYTPKNYPKLHGIDKI